MRLVYARDNDLTYNSIGFDISLQNFKKPLDVFWPQLNTKKKRSEEYLVTIFGYKKKALSDFLPSSSSWKIARKHREVGLKHKSARFFIKFISLCLPYSWFSETLYPNTCLREWKLLSLCTFNRIIFILLIVSSLSRNFHRCAACF